jgi:hypothetical protein
VKKADRTMLDGATSDTKQQWLDILEQAASG